MLGGWRVAYRLAWVFLLLVLGLPASAQAQTEMSIGVLAFRGEEDALDISYRKCDRCVLPEMSFQKYTKNLT